MKAFAGIDIPENLQDAVRPNRTALVVYDMQIGILQQLSGGQAVLEKVLAVLDAARSAGVRVIFMRHMSLPKRLSGAFQLRQMMVWQRKTSPDDVHPWFLRSNPGFELAPQLAVRDDEAVLDKITMSAFEGTPLPIALRDCGLTSFVIAGIATEIGIEPTVRHTDRTWASFPWWSRTPVAPAMPRPASAPWPTCASWAMRSFAPPMS
jgi:nicotinamidase-related amidase